MAERIIITYEFTDPSDLDFYRTRIAGENEELADEIKEEGRLDGEIEVGWELEP